MCKPAPFENLVNLLLVDCEFCERLVVKHTTDDLQWLWTQFGVLEEGAAKARLAGVKAGEERLRSG